MTIKAKIKSSFKNPYAYLAFFIPITIMAICYACLGIYWGSSRTVLASDAFSQFSNFHASFNNVLKGKESIFYTWNSSLGLNYWALISYYLGGIFTPIVFFFDNSQIPDVIYLLTLLKIGLAALSFWYFSKNTYKLSDYTHVALAVSYSLMSYITVHSELIMWLDAFIYLPLVFLGLHRLMDQRKPALLFFSYFLVFISNFYFGFMIGLLSFLYYFAKTFGNWSTYKRSIPHYFLTSLLAGGASMIMILPVVADLRANGEGLSAIIMKKTAATGPADFFIKNMIGVYDTTKYDSIPFVYIGLIPLIFCLFYFLSKQYLLRQKILYGLIFVFIFTSFYIEPLNLFWHGFHSPNMFLFRFSFTCSFLVIVLAGYGLEAFTRKELPKVLTIGLLLTTSFIITYSFYHKDTYSYLTLNHLLITLGFLVVYLGVLLYYRRIHNFFGQVAPFYLKKLSIILLLMMSLEAGLNTYGIVNGILKDWNYPSRSLYSGPYPDYKDAVNTTQKKDKDGFYRIESLNPITANESINYGFHSISQFSSIRNRNSAQLLHKLGYRSRGANANTRYENNTLIADSLFGVKYNLSKNLPQKYGFTEDYRNSTYQVYKNAYALGLGAIVPNDVNKLTMDPVNMLSNQSDLINAMTKTTQLFYTYSTPKVTHLENVTVVDAKDKSTVTYKEKEFNIGKKITWEVFVPANKQAYLKLQPTDYNQIKSSTAEVSVNGQKHSTQLKNNGQYYNLGSYLEDTTLTFSVDFFGTPEVSFVPPTVIFLNLDSYKTAFDKLKEQSVNFNVKGRTATAEVTVGNDEMLFTTIPYDNGWQAYVDGKEVPIKAFDDALITIPLTKGTHKIELRFLPEGLILGFYLLLACVTLFIIYLTIVTRLNNKQKRLKE